ncbi:MAG: AraC family transcriptional regulator [Actinobacteria bacterium 13_2_20CM_2_71_6]|nr:MAG: AraC family transcriptional regulator [Actinobacteria bacterium 13_2_20CM_2_71_6]
MTATPPVPVDLLAHLRAARDLIDRAYAEPLDLARLARQAGCSRYHFLRAFAATYGQTPRRYLTHRRIERAKELLRTANLTVTEICVLVGFSSLGSFSSRFSKLVGMSPTAYRARAVEAGGPPPVPGCFVLMWSHPAIAEKQPDHPAS